MLNIMPTVGMIFLLILAACGPQQGLNNQISAPIVAAAENIGDNNTVEIAEVMQRLDEISNMPNPFSNINNLCINDFVWQDYITLDQSIESNIAQQISSFLDEYYSYGVSQQQLLSNYESSIGPLNIMVIDDFADGSTYTPDGFVKSSDTVGVFFLIQ